MGASEVGTYVPTGTDRIHSMDNIFLIFRAILSWELSIQPPSLKRETQIHRPSIVVPAGTMASPQASKEVKIWL